MWSSNKKVNPQDTSKIDNVQFKNINESARAEINQAAQDMEQIELEKRMVSFLQSRGFDVTPSGTPKPGIITKSVLSVANTAENAFHVGRGVVRKFKNNVETKVEELRKLGE